MPYSLLSILLYLAFSQAPQKPETSYLLAREFHYELGQPTEYQNGLEVHGHSDVYRIIRFLDSTQFDEVIFKETKFYDAALKDSSNFQSLKNGFEVSVLKGNWSWAKDSVLSLNYQKEDLYDFAHYGLYLQFLGKSREEQSKVAVLRSRAWNLRQNFILNKEGALCIIDGLHRCYQPDY